MTLLEAAATGILPQEYSDLVIKAIAAEALAFNPALATLVTTNRATFNIPVVDEDAAASWVAEGSEITPDDPTLSELPVTPAKAAGLTIISRELAMDSSPDAQQIVADGLARSIVRQINAAWLGNLAGPAPKGLASLNASQVITAAGGLQNLDPFAVAVAQAESAGGTITGWVLSPAEALTVATLKTGSGSNQTLTQTPREILGRPVFVNSNVPQGTAWGVDAATAITVLREDLELAISADAYFTSDRIAIRSTARIGFGFPKPLVINRITVTA
ncbi:phage major capsid protein [Arthrobacter sp. L77]|uniref:phage major capsid protein n=1 Tax=Arthrobacter sp. L77 TaxID=1496689 RepID=UPI0005B9BEEE|nr:phage major capsid protein [Arthrobacter sp. L77]